MKILKNFMRVAAVCAVAFTFTACGGDDEEPGGGSEIVDPDQKPTPEPNPDVDAMDPAAAKGYLEDTAIELLSIVQPSDHETLVRIVGYWNENYGEYEAPAVWNLDALEGDDDDYYKARRHNPLRHMMRALGKAAKGDIAAMSRAMNEVLNVARFSGIYEPGRDSYGDGIWVKTGNSKDVVFKFPCNGNTVEVKAFGEGGTWGEQEGGIRVEVPRKATLILNNGGTELVNAVVESNLDFNAHTINVDLNASLVNVNLKSSTKGDNNSIRTETYAFYAGRQVARSTATVNGRNMVDRNAIKNLFKEEKEHYEDGYGNVYEEVWYEFDVAQAEKMFIDGKTDSDVLGKIRVAGTITGFGRLMAESEKYFDCDEYSDKEAALRDCQQQAEVIKELVDVKLYLAGSANSSAEVDYKPYFDGEENEYYSWWEWYNEPVLLFADGSTTSMEGYFGGNNFMGLDTPLRNIIYAYEGYWLNYRH